MKALKIKDSHTTAVIGFNNSGIPLGHRSQEDLIDLAIMAHDSGNTALNEVFTEPLPALAELKKAKLVGIEKEVTTPKPASK